MRQFEQDVGHISKSISIAPVFGVADVAFLPEVERQPPKLIRPLGQAGVKRGLRCPLRTVVEIVECQPDLRFGERDPPGIVILERFRPCAGPGREQVWKRQQHCRDLVRMLPRISSMFRAIPDMRIRRAKTTSFGLLTPVAPDGRGTCATTWVDAARKIAEKAANVLIMWRFRL